MAKTSQTPRATKFFLVAVIAAVILAAPASPLADERIAGLEISSDEASGWKLPRQLSEISGLATTSDGRLFAHGDENGIIFELDPKAGKIVKAFALGDVTVKADFEGIAMVDDMVYLVTSDGTIYEAPEGSDGERVLFNSYGTGVGRQCEVEGLAYEKTTGDLLLACKTARVPELAGHLAVFRWNVKTRTLQQSLALLVPLELINAGDPLQSLHPSGIEVLAGTGNFLVIAAQERLILELTSGGDSIAVRRLAPELHVQPEGVTMLPDGILLIADDGGNGPGPGRGRLTLYKSSGSEQ